MRRLWNLHTLLVGRENGVVNVERALAAFHKVKLRNRYHVYQFHSEIFIQENWKYMYSQIFCRNCSQEKYHRSESSPFAHQWVRE